MINAGKYNKQITIYRTEVIEDADGFQTTVNTIILQPYASVKTTKGFTLIANGTDFEKALQILLSGILQLRLHVICSFLLEVKLTQFNI